MLLNKNVNPLDSSGLRKAIPKIPEPVTQENLQPTLGPVNTFDTNKSPTLPPLEYRQYQVPGAGAVVPPAAPLSQPTAAQPPQPATAQPAVTPDAQPVIQGQPDTQGQPPNSNTEQVPTETETESDLDNTLQGQDSTTHSDFNISLSPVNSEPDLTDEGILVKNTRKDDKAKSLSEDEKEFVRQIVMHINQFDEELISIFLEPLVSFNKNTNAFEAHFEKTTNLNQRYLHEIMTTPRFKDVLNMKQPTFVNLIQVYLKKFKHGIAPKAKGNKQT